MKSPTQSRRHMTNEEVEKVLKDTEERKREIGLIQLDSPQTLVLGGKPILLVKAPRAEGPERPAPSDPAKPTEPAIPADPAPPATPPTTDPTPEPPAPVAPGTTRETRTERTVTKETTIDDHTGGEKKPDDTTKPRKPHRTNGGNPPDRIHPTDRTNGDGFWKRNWWWIALLFIILILSLVVTGLLIEKHYPGWKSIFAKNKDVPVQTDAPKTAPDSVTTINESGPSNVLTVKSGTNSAKMTTSTKTEKPLVRNEQRDVAGSINAPNNSGIQFNVLLNGEELKKLAEKPKTKMAMLGMPEKPDYEEYLVKEGTMPQVGVKLTVEKTVRPGNGTRFHFPKGFKPDAEIDLDRREFEFWMNIGTKDDPEWTVYKSDPSKPKPKCESYWVRIKTTTPAKIVFTLTPSPRKDP